MAHWGCFLLLFLGLGSLSSSVPRQFHVVKEQKNWTEAQQYCREEFTDLATIDNMTEMEKVNHTIHEVSAENGNRAAWIGLFKQNDAWKWSDGSNSSFRKWNTGEPNNGDGKEFCTKILNPSGAWNDAGCDHRSHFICYEGESLSIFSAWNGQCGQCVTDNIITMSC
ncbi:C-type lectin lectoxin-Phi1-like [Alosa sapidissima]|uniref:C-type lectin lectoxin-Phi1-like n=1 Tax=Alosa sapidissima TaxID=34773 RepID=UPI001C085E7F|nr:C-type lectin lectoxin-Phi1-like [Alosa sapidissima]